MFRWRQMIPLLLLLVALPSRAQVKIAEIAGRTADEPGGAFTASTGVTYLASDNTGYVSNPGSGVLTKFRSSSGEVLKTLKLAPGIGPLAVSKDGSRLAVVNPQNQKIYLVSPGDLTLRAETGYAGSGFTARSNVAFGYSSGLPILFFVSDPSRDAVALFGVANGVFDRLINVGRGPNAMATHPDGKTIGVLCSGNQVGDPSSVYLLDTETRWWRDFHELEGLDAESFNGLAFDAGGEYVYACSYNNNRIAVYNLRTQIRSQRESRGAGPTRVFTSPNGNSLAVIHKTSNNITVFTLPEVVLYKDIVLPGMEFAEDSTLAFSPDSRQLYIPSRATGELLTYDLITQTLVHRAAVGRAPLMVNAVPGGALVSTLDIGSNVLSLVALNPMTTYIPDLIQDRDNYSGIAIANFADEARSLALTARDDQGNLIPGTNNPLLIKLGPKQQAVGIAYQLFGLSASATLSGYIEVFTLGTGTSVLYITGNTNQTQLDGFVAEAATGKRLGFPRITEGLSRFGRMTSTELALLNPTDRDAQIQLAMYYRTLEGPGRLIANVELALKAHNRVRRRISELMPSSFYPLDKAYVELNSNEAVKGIALIRVGDSMAIAPALPRGLPTLDFSANQFVSGGAGSGDATPYFSDLSLSNSSQEPITVTSQVLDSTGRTVPPGTRPVVRTLQPSEAASGGADSMLGFPNPLTDPARYEGRLQISADKPGLLADLLYGDARNGSFLTEGHLTAPAGTVFGLGHVAQVRVTGKDYYTGLAMFNPTLGRANLVIDVYKKDGSLFKRANYSLSPLGRDTKTIGQIVPDLGEINGGTITITSDVQIQVFAVWGSGPDFLCAVPAVVLTQ